MTTKVTVSAHAGWPVDVTRIDPKTGKPPENQPAPTERVASNSERIFYVHSAQDLLVHEVQPGEEPRAMSFGDAIAALKAGKRVARAGWNGKGMFLFLVPGGYMDHPHFNGQALPYIAMKTVQGDSVPWLASQADVLSEDWELVPA